MSHRRTLSFCAFAVAVVLASPACGGRTALIPTHQIGRLSSDAVVASDAGVRIVLRTDAWPGPRLDVWRLFPVEVTLDNGSTHGLRVRRQDVGLVTPSGQRIGPVDVSGLQLEAPAAEGLATRALADRVVDPGERVSGFLYFRFPEPPEADSLQFRIDLIDATSETAFGLVEIPFYVEES